MTWTGRGAPCQRWRDGATAVRSDDDGDLRRYEVAPIAGDAEPRGFVQRHHYSGSYPAARFRVGLYRASELVGVAVFSHPPSERVLARLPCERLAGVELGRLVLLPTVPGNGESYFIAQCFRHLRGRGIDVVVAHSDPVPRTTAAGSVVLPGHVGIVYQATNAVYAGRTKRNLLALMPDGTVFSSRSMSKIRRRERGYRYCVEQLVSAGAPPPSSDLPEVDLTAWMWTAISLVCRRLGHDGNLRYVWALDRSLRRAVGGLACGQPYPRSIDQLAASGRE